MIRTLYRLLLRAYPADFRAEFERELIWSFNQQLARRESGLGRALFFASVVVDVTWTALRERAFQRTTRVQRVGGGLVDLDAEPRFRSNRGTRIASLAPLWLGLPIVAIAPGALEMLVTSPPDILGVPATLLATCVALTWMSLGTIVVWYARHAAVAAIALLVFSIPATVAVILGPIAFRYLMELA
jgi:hypothetical protein